MSNSELNAALNEVESGLNELENLLADGAFSRNQITSMLKNNTSSARENGKNVLFSAIKQVGTHCENLENLKNMFPNETRIASLLRRYAFCGQQLLENYNMVESWG